MENNGVKYGLLAGGLVIAYTLLLYLIDEQMLFGGASTLGVVIYIIGMYKAGMDQRKSLGGFISWKEALTPTFLTYVIGSLLATIFTYLLFTIIDPGLMEVQNEIARESIIQMEGLIGEEGVEKAMEKLEERGTMNFSDTALSYAFMLIFGFVVAAVISAVIKRNRPESV